METDTMAGSPPAFAETAAATPDLPLEKYLPDLADIDVSDDEKLEVLRALCEMMRVMVMFNFDVGSFDIEQALLGELPGDDE